MFEGVIGQDFIAMLRHEGYKVVTRLFHAHVLVDEKVGEHILLLKKIVK